MIKVVFPFYYHYFGITVLLDGVFPTPHSSTMSDDLSDSWRRWAAALGFAGVGAGAFGAHALKATLASRGTTDSWRTAVRIH